MSETPLDHGRHVPHPNQTLSQGWDAEGREQVEDSTGVLVRSLMSRQSAAQQHPSSRPGLLACEHRLLRRAAGARSGSLAQPMFAVTPGEGAALRGRSSGGAPVAEMALRQPGPVAMLTSDVDDMVRLCGNRVRLIGI
ncbi:hypothetical protein ACFYOK_03175 [Microbispora bryophytorum]|uniref:hypothetical protein n=1 Tax=Microbispora bryophytorum TaxID=1460882 RepID=UPI0033F28FAF